MSCALRVMNRHRRKPANRRFRRIRTNGILAKAGGRVKGNLGRNGRTMSDRTTRGRRVLLSSAYGPVGHCPAMFYSAPPLGNRVEVFLPVPSDLRPPAYRLRPVPFPLCRSCALVRPLPFLCFLRSLRRFSSQCPPASGLPPMSSPGLRRASSSLTLTPGPGRIPRVREPANGLARIVRNPDQPTPMNP
jgi:hypothetical protein